MFDSFFEEYRKICQGYDKKVWIFTIFCIIGFLCTVTFPFFKIFGVPISEVRFIILVVLAVFFVIVLCVVSWLEKKSDQKFQRRNFNIRIAILKELLEYDKYKMHSPKGLDYLIESCEKKINKKNLSEIPAAFKNFFVVFIYPLITLLIGLFAKEIDINKLEKNVSWDYAVLIAYGLIVVPSFFIILKSLFPYFMYGNKSKYECLLNDLEYLKTQLPD